MKLPSGGIKFVLKSLFIAFWQIQMMFFYLNCVLKRSAALPGVGLQRCWILKKWQREKQCFQKNTQFFDEILCVLLRI